MDEFPSRSSYLFECKYYDKKLGGYLAQPNTRCANLIIVHILFVYNYDYKQTIWIYLHFEENGKRLSIWLSNETF